MKFSADALPSILTTEGREGVPGPLEGGGRGLRATPSLYHSCPGHMEGFIFFWWGCSFCQSSMSAWEVLSGDAENKSACHQGALRQVLR